MHEMQKISDLIKYVSYKIYLFSEENVIFITKSEKISNYINWIPIIGH